MDYQDLPIELIQCILSYFSFPYGEVCHIFDSFSKFCSTCFGKRNGFIFVLYKNILFEETSIKRPLYSSTSTISEWITDFDVKYLLLLAQWNCSLSILLNRYMDQCSISQKLLLVHLLFHNKIFAASIYKWQSNPFLFTTVDVKHHWKCNNLISLNMEGLLTKNLANISHTPTFTPLFRILPQCPNLKSLILSDTALSYIIKDTKLLQNFPPNLEHLEILFAFPPEHLEILLKKNKLLHLKSIKIRSSLMSFEVILALFINAPKLESISLSDINLPSECNWFSLINELPNFTSFESIYSKPYDISSLKTSLKQICFWNCTIQQGYDSLLHCTQIHTLSLNYLRIGAEELHSIISHCKCLRSLSLDGCQLNSDLIRLLLDNKTTLKECSLLSCEAKRLIDRQLFMELLAHNTTLQWLHVDLELINSLKFLQTNQTLKGLVLGEYKEDYFDFNSNDWSNSSLECLFLHSFFEEQLRISNCLSLIGQCLKNIKCLICGGVAQVDALEQCLLQREELHVYFFSFKLYATNLGKTWESRLSPLLHHKIVNQIHCFPSAGLFDYFEVGKQSLEHYTTNRQFL